MNIIGCVSFVFNSDCMLIGGGVSAAGLYFTDALRWSSPVGTDNDGSESRNFV